jgi:pimeloyl-ACP methyl ester carboxylesterase
MGGYVALAVHRLAPQRCRALILADTRAEPDTDEARPTACACTRRERGPSGAAGDAARWSGRRQAAGRPEQMKAIAGANTAEGIVDGLEALKTRPDARPGLAIAWPTLVIVGADDALPPPAVAEALRDGIAGAQLVVIPDAGHMSNLEQPVPFALALWSFLR